MDAAVEQDIELQRNAASYIQELKAKLPRFLFQTLLDGRQDVRSYVRAKTTFRLCNLLEPFQEWPQLLDPHLPALVRPLQDALQKIHVVADLRGGVQQDELVQPLDFAVCKLLYTLCKVRGAKVISRFLDSGAENLEVALGALETKFKISSERTEQDSQVSAAWEERYIYMLWISHLLFAPFDLKTIGSEYAPESVRASIRLPSGIPTIAIRLVRAAMLHISAPSKEREAAVKMLSRLAARPDMIRFGVHDSLLNYALSTLKTLHGEGSQAGPYELIGCLSLLAGLLSSLKAIILKPYNRNVFKSLLVVTNGNGSGHVSRINTAVSRKLIVKNLRLIATLALQPATEAQEQEDSIPVDYVLEETIDYLLGSLADNDTPVRQAASKAISTIVLSLDADLAADVVDAVVGSLDENVLWLDEASSQYVRTQRDLLKSDKHLAKRDLSAVNPLRWHGLVLTLAQLLFQRSAPATQLPVIINCLVLALGFEQRTTSGTSVGGNVRDAANFGLWSIARKYSTEELLKVPLESVRAITMESYAVSISIIQALAAELVVAATLDPSGNIRRGSSAALQELIGRHPDTIFEGIPIVQVVDYHAISLRSNAFSKVAVKAARLHRVYWESLLVAMMGWRGLEAADANSRRLAATSISQLAQVFDSRGTTTAAQLIYTKLSRGRIRDVEKLHGLLLAGSALMPTITSDATSTSLIARFWALLNPGTLFEQEDLTFQTRKPDLSAEAISEFIASISHTSAQRQDLQDAIEPRALENCMASLTLAMDRREPPVLQSAAKGVNHIFPLLDQHSRGVYIKQWIAKVDARLTAHDTGPYQGYLSGLASAYDDLDPATERKERNDILATLFRALTNGPIDDVHTRVASLAALRQGIFQEARDVSTDVVAALLKSLQDYTVDERGDIGSLVRLEAVEVVRRLLIDCHFPRLQDKQTLLAQVAVLAGEKLDKLRFYAWTCLRDNWSLLSASNPPPAIFSTITQTSSRIFFADLLDLVQIPWLQRPILQGICVSAGAGSESTLRAARTALIHHLLNVKLTELLSIHAVLLAILHDNLTEDRICVPILDTWAFLIQSNIFPANKSPSFNYRRLFVLVQKAHFKSSNIQKLTAAVHLYMALAENGEVREDVFKKLSAMLLHPLPKVRNAAADALFVTSSNENLLQMDWSKAPRELKSMAEKVKIGIVADSKRDSVAA